MYVCDDATNLYRVSKLYIIWFRFAFYVYVIINDWYMNWSRNPKNYVLIFGGFPVEYSALVLVLIVIVFDFDRMISMIEWITCIWYNTCICVCVIDGNYSAGWEWYDNICYWDTIHYIYGCITYLITWRSVWSDGVIWCEYIYIYIYMIIYILFQ